ncbi:MAG: (d)CMP kinase, partial [Alphaproteobacteria bacterium]|nr:(d)CMP kinase [Alphaproteobacteria bacterium]
LRGDAVADAASRVAAIPAVRAELLELQRDFAAHPPGGASGAILDGRDIGSVICPQADVKLFVTASPEIRAQRRFTELARAGQAASFEEVLADIHARDRRDSARATAPLRQLPDAHLVDTSNLSVDEAIATALAIVDAARRP